MDAQTAETRVLAAAYELFYERGVQAVGMDEIRATSGVSLKRLYKLFPAKERLVESYLRQRDERLRESMTRYVEAHESPERRLLAVFDWLHEWFSEPDFRGCAFINMFGELGSTSPVVIDATRAHKEAVRQYLTELVAAADQPAWLTDQLALLVEGAITTAAIFGTAEPARQARAAAARLLTTTRND
ncbi:TetR/AcrR family transcriptional regulator [Goodfellowiella coeruleoviolacea]|uniref:TetR/AcrR family transcriptional regulator n=1 Tax=Goodfellowiella coeruleoviolacea TaxID=334858 RepID=UPI0020A5BF19|nr:TetR/AcrR family transcriptional regulator [Goodfellowiella coeruleoviolacea]